MVSETANIYATLRFTWVKERNCKKQYYWSYNLILVHGTIFTNHYNSVSTSEILLKNKTRVCGTIRENCGLPNQLKEKSKNLQRGEMTSLRKGEVILLIRKGKRLVRMVTTIHDASIASTGKEDRRTGRQITKPTCILDYNKYMRGVNQSDQYLANFNILWKT